jgi:hypothetical protein
MVETMEHELASRKVPGSISRCSCGAAMEMDARNTHRRK